MLNILSHLEIVIINFKEHFQYTTAFNNTIKKIQSYFVPTNMKAAIVDQKLRISDIQNNIFTNRKTSRSTFEMLYRKGPKLQYIIYYIYIYILQQCIIQYISCKSIVVSIDIEYVNAPATVREPRKLQKKYFENYKGMGWLYTRINYILCTHNIHR